MAQLESDLGDMALEMAGLTALKEQLQEALEGARRRAANSAQPQPNTTTQLPRPPAATPVAAARVEPQRPVLSVAPSASTSGKGERVTVVHLDDQPLYQETMRTLIEKFGFARYCLASESSDELGATRRLLALNLLTENVEPLASVADASRWGIEYPAAFTYCGDGTRGFVLGMTDFFPPPFDPNMCVTRLLERPSPTQRLLVVSDAVDATSEVRSILTRLGCATSVAFDGRQAAALLPMVRPDVMLIDLNLPKGDAMRIIAKVRADAANANVTFGVMWQQPIVAAEFRAQAARAARDLPLSTDDLRRAMGREMGPGGAVYAPSASKAA